MAAASKTISGTIRAILSDRCDQKEELRGFAQEIVSEISDIDPSGSKGMLDLFISELVLSAADQRRKRERRQRQAEGIAAAKAKGVRFGRMAKAAPDNFDEVHQAWREGGLSLQQAADACGVARGTFYGMAIRKEQTADQTA